eukprot:TRINITY_DN22160_c0_g1_i3.p1 TRINITY_DN22160_c0_g1~~TRINITY_DN22160_c0_g1_i3.p1  ORF type:complete len:103 (-),score=21.64 TRINITY_DN22160_c0_g1_i3:46-354(-)
MCIRDRRNSHYKEEVEKESVLAEVKNHSRAESTISEDKTVKLKDSFMKDKKLTIPELMQKQLESEKYLEELKQDIAVRKDITVETIYPVSYTHLTLPTICSV